MRRLILHVGLGKTGSSAIQQVLRTNRAKLQEEGIFYCDLWLTGQTLGEAGFGSPAVLAELLRDGDRTAIAESIYPIFDREFGGAHTIIWSNEALAMRWASMGTLLRRAATCYDVTVILFFRNQVDWLVSAYLQWAVKHKQNQGRIKTWEEYIRGTSAITDYASIIEGWESTGAMVIPRSYDETENVVDDFCQAIGLGIKLKGTDVRVYETPLYTALALFKILNDQYSEPRSPDALLRLLAGAGVLDRDIHPVDPCPLNIPENHLPRLMERFAATNRDLVARYGIRLHSSPRTPRISSRDHSDPTNTDLIAALLMVILNQDERIRTLEQRARR